MNLRNSRIVIVDDSLDDVKKLLTFFDREGVPYNYYQPPELKNLPRKPLKDIRVLFLDFDFGVSGQSPVKNKISVLMGIFKKLLAKDNGPYILVAWTTFNTGTGDLITPFKEAIMADPSLPRPVIIFDMDKSVVMNDLKKIEQNIKKAFNGSNVFELLLRWGNHADKAISHLLNNLLDISTKRLPAGLTSFDGYATELNKAMQFHVHKFATSLLGAENLKANKDLLIAGQMPFINFFQDLIESSIKEDGHDFRNLEKSTYQFSRPPLPAPYTVKEKAELNSIFLLSSKPESFAQPGNIYMADPVFRILTDNGRHPLINQVVPKNSDLIQDFIQSPNGQHRQWFLRRAKKILMEITPECDFAQNNWKAARLVLGVLMPYVDTMGAPNSFLKKSDKVTPSLPVVYKNQVYLMTFHNIYQYSLGIKALTGAKPILRARKDLLVDIQHWFASHISRPGKTEF